MSSGLIDNLLGGVGLLCLWIIVVALIVALILYMRSKKVGEKPLKVVSLICESCGAENPAENKFCEQCGEALTS